MKLTNRQKWGAITLTLSVALVSALVWLFPRNGDNSGQKSIAVRNVADGEVVPTMVVKKVDSFTRSIVHTGLIQSRNRTLVSFQRSGKVDQVLVDEGRRVKRGEAIASMDNRHLRAQLSSLEARLQQATWVLAELQQGPRQESINAARNLLVDLKQQLKAQELRLARSAELRRTNSIPKQDYERELYSGKALKARVDAAQDQLDELNAGTRQEKIDAQKSLVASLEADKLLVLYNLDDCNLTAPFGGIIVQRMLDDGTVVTAGSPVVELLDDQNLELHVGVPIALAKQLEIGSRFDVHAGETQLQGILRAVLPQVDSNTRTCKLVLDLAPADGMPGTVAESGLISGQLARLDMQETIRETGYWIPRTSLTLDHSGLWSCLVVTDIDSHGEPVTTQTGNQSANRTTNQTVKQSVEVLQTRDEWAFVRGTLQDGQRIVCDGIHRVVAGQQVVFRDVELPSDTEVVVTPSSSISK